MHFKQLLHIITLVIFCFHQSVSSSPKFTKISTQFIAALGEPSARHGTGAQQWGIWTVDPGPRGVRLEQAQHLITTGRASKGWIYDPKEFWIEEHGLIMEPPSFPLQDGDYLVTGGRATTTILTIQGDAWSLKEGTLYDVTHLPCRSARYIPQDGSKGPLNAVKEDFPVTPGAAMPDIEHCTRLDYWVVFVVGLVQKDDL